MYYLFQKSSPDISKMYWGAPCNVNLYAEKRFIKNMSEKLLKTEKGGLFLKKKTENRYILGPGGRNPQHHCQDATPGTHSHKAYFSSSCQPLMIQSQERVWSVWPESYDDHLARGRPYWHIFLPPPRTQGEGNSPHWHQGAATKEGESKTTINIHHSLKLNVGVTGFVLSETYFSPKVW